MIMRRLQRPWNPCSSLRVRRALTSYVSTILAKEIGRGGDNILGSTAIFAAVDTALIMQRTERDRTISSILRYGEDLPETVLHFDPQTRTVTLGEVKEQEEEKRLADTIREFLE